MHVDESQPLAVKPASVDEAEDFGVRRLGGLRQRCEQAEEFRAAGERSACQFADDERMANDAFLL
jgi:hypothetical protein